MRLTDEEIEGLMPEGWDAPTKKPRDLEAFLAQFPSPMTRGKVRAALTRPMSLNGVLNLRHAHIEDYVREGRRVVTVSGEVRLENPQTGCFFTEVDLTKTAINYAQFLLAEGEP